MVQEFCSRRCKDRHHNQERMKSATAYEALKSEMAALLMKHGVGI